jgi:hypothetical protein
MAIVQAKKEIKPLNATDRIDQALMKAGKFEITPEMNFTIKIFLKEMNGRWVLMNRAGVGTEEHEVVFRMWTYNEMIEMKKMSTNFDDKKRMHLTDNDMLNRLKIQRFMLSWTFDRDNPRLKIQHVHGVMTDEGWDAFIRLQPNIATYIIEEMNKVYDFNG